MKPKASQKNFTYGELWPSEGLPPKAGERRGKVLVNPEKFTNNTMFLRYLQRYGYRLFLDYQTHEPAKTRVSTREIIISGAYSDRMIGDLLQHELGHLVLFDVNQFLSVRPDTLRSSIAKVLYTPEHLVAHGIAKLLMTENIVQDIIIETLAEGECVCHGYYVLHGERMGVKHMERLEDPALIAKEVCDELLRVPTPSEARQSYSLSLDELIDSMLKGLEGDNEDIEKAMEKVKNSKEDPNSYRRIREAMGLKGKIAKLEKALDAASDMDRRAHLENLLNGQRSKLEQVESPERVAKDKAANAARKARELKNLQDKLDSNHRLEELLRQEQGEGRGDGNGNSKKASGTPEESPGEGNSEGDGEPKSGESGDEASGAGTNDKTSEISRNLTDHLADDSAPPGGAHSYDCGFPHPLKATREELDQNQKFGLKRLSSSFRGRTLKISVDEGDDVLSNRTKSQENEHTYFKSSKKEFGMEDMLKGKRRLRLAGVNVLIGLDISGSMSREWTTLFKELSELVQELQETIDIENIVYFTYNQALQQHSRVFDDLTLRANGGNSFGYVYQELMQKLPLMQKNEIILVTDCGDNLGFDLNANCEVERGGAPVENHISVIDTEGAAFYNKDDLNAKDWSLHRYGDSDLFSNIRMNIEQLIDR